MIFHTLIFQESNCDRTQTRKTRKKKNESLLKMKERKTNSAYFERTWALHMLRLFQRIWTLQTQFPDAYPSQISSFYIYSQHALLWKTWVSTHLYPLVQNLSEDKLHYFEKWVQIYIHFIMYKSFIVTTYSGTINSFFGGGGYITSYHLNNSEPDY